MNILVKYYINDPKIIYGFTLRLCNYDHEKTKDLINEAITKILGKDIQFDKEKASETTMFCTIIKNMFLDNVNRKRENFHKVELSENDRSSHLEMGLDLPIIIQQINKLSNKQKNILSLRIEGYSYQEISVKLNMDEGTVKSHIFRARGVLKSKLSKLGFEINY